MLNKADREEEKRLIERAKNDPQAFGRLYDQYHPRIFSYIYRRTLDFDLAADLTSETFLKAFLKIWQFKWKGLSAGAWFYRIATNEINMYFRNRNYHPESLDELRASTGFELADNQNYLQEKIEAERRLEAYQDFLRVQSIIRTLPVKYQEVLALRYFEQKTVPEIAEILNKKTGTVKSLISRGVERIRKEWG